MAFGGAARAIVKCGTQATKDIGAEKFVSEYKSDRSEYKSHVVSLQDQAGVPRRFHLANQVISFRMLLPLSSLHAATHLLYRARGATSRTVQLGARRFHLYEKTGTGRGPPVLLVHGLSGNAYSFAPLLGPLARLCRRVVLIDLAGHGRSLLGSDELPANAMEHAASIGEALQLFGEPALLVGNSLGGGLALHAAAQFPRRVAAVVALAPAGAPLSGADRAVLRDVFQDNLSSAMERIRRLYHHRPLPALLFARDMARQASVPAVQTILSALISADGALPPRVLSAIRCPVLVLWGASDQLLPASSVDYFRAHLHNGQVEVIPNCGHLPQLERPQFVAARIERLLGSL